MRDRSVAAVEVAGGMRSIVGFAVFEQDEKTTGMIYPDS